MPIAKLANVELYYEETGQGFPLVWSHEFGGDHRSWEPQVRYFSRRYQVITYNHRGYAPSTVPREASA
jgi:pimeloyl-ACP methyl ester carboxylesterase